MRDTKKAIRNILAKDVISMSSDKDIYGKTSDNWRKTDHEIFKLIIKAKLEELQWCHNNYRVLPDDSDQIFAIDDRIVALMKLVEDDTYDSCVVCADSEEEAKSVLSVDTAVSEHKHPKKPVPMPDVTPEEIAAWKSGVIGKIEGMSVVRIDKPITPTLYKPNRAMRRNKND